MQIKDAAEREMRRMKEIFNNIEIANDKKAAEFYSFAENYFKDGKYFFEKEKYVESFEAFIIAWAYIDAGLKLSFFNVNEKIKEYFTV